MVQYSANAGCPGCAYRWGTGSTSSPKKDLPVIDVRKPDTTGAVSISGSKYIPYDELVERMDELDENNPTIFFVMVRNAHNHR